MTVQQMDRAVVRKAVNVLLDAGFELSVFDGGEWQVRSSKLSKPVIDALLSTDESFLHVGNDGKITSRFIRFVFGNDGYDAICDYSCSLEEALKPVEEYCDELEEKYC